MEEIRPVGVEDMLRARDARVQRQNMLLEKYAVPLISFTMNIAGSIKVDAKIKRAFSEGRRRVERSLERMKLVPLEYIETLQYTGCEGLWTVCGDAAELKKSMCAIEEADALGRLFDIDVIDADGSHITRTSERSCLICGKPVRACARSRAHSAEELFARVHVIIDGYFQKVFAQRVGCLAQRALLYETLTTPKPGLVDRENSGAHSDMDLFSFADSSCALRRYFEECVRLGMENAGFERLQYAGLRAEDDMFAAAGVNTHKGAIFSMGIICYALGSCGEGAAIGDVLQKAAELGQCALRRMQQRGTAETGGEQQYLHYGLTGARGEAASGFESVLKIALPALRKALSEGKTLNDAGLHALLALMSRVYDSNIIRRAGMDGQRWASEQAAGLLSGEFDHDALRTMNAAFVEKNISPGGSADLLALTYFLHFLYA